ncbi:Putative collagen-binding domain of a collagenase [Cellulomonas marina]|uniref:Putative collagen-binding domain of a collagenase n=1 Tax=Cellulomonas marina TaxID=988821 RepID=A0A1I1ADD8_9CELL|nr:Putative collagen-binding domain of a collagenase [Cellulomonas marina]
MLAAALVAPLAAAPAAATATTDSTGTSAVRVTLAGAPFRDAAGRTWAAATGTVGGRAATTPLTSVAGTTDDGLYARPRVGLSAQPVRVPAAGTYRMTLHLVENYHTAVGRRVLSVTAEGRPVVTGLDLVATAGPRTAHRVTADVEVRDGVLDLALTASRDLTTLSAVEAVLLPTTSTGGAATDAAPTTRPAFPLRASADGTRLVDAVGAPFTYLADTPWLAPTSLDQAATRALLDTRAAQGFTAVQLSALAFLHRDDPRNAYGDLPFVGGTDLARPLEVGARTTDPASPDYDYWDHLDWVVDQAAQRGLAVTLVPSWYGYAGEDWRRHLTTTAATSYGRFLATRLGDAPNLVWMLGGDNNPTSDDTARVPAGGDRSDRTAATDAMAAAIRAAEPVRHLMTYHARRTVSSLVHFGDRPWHTLVSAYADERVAAAVAAASGRGRPVVVTEAYYDGRTSTPVLDARRLRTQAWAAVLGGAGYAYGHEAVWDLDGTWRTALSAPSAADVTRLRTLLRPLGPVRPGPTVLLAGAGDPATTDRAVTGCAGRTALTYVPTPRTLTVDLAALGGTTVRLAWLSPATGVRTELGDRPASGSVRLTTPGTADAVLVIEAR